MQSYHFGWYTIFVLHKINLIESFKEYLIGSKDFLNFSSLSRYKVNLDYTIHTYFWDLCFHLTGLLFVLGFHSFTFAPHCLIHLLTRSSHLYGHNHTLIILHAFLHLYGHLTQRLPHSTALTHSLSLTQHENFNLLHWCVIN